VTGKPPLVPLVADPATLSNIERLGLEIFARDAAAWRATDSLSDASGNPPPSRGATGWIVVPAGNQWLVRFITDEELAAYDVHVDVTSPDAPVAKVNEPPAPLSADEAAMWRARKTAAGSDFRRCSDRYNSVVLPGEWEGSPAWVVYMLAASTDPADIMLGGHHRIHISGDGGSILQSRALTLSCLRGQRSSSTAMLGVSHSMDPEPIESHVFLNLSYRTPLAVMTESGAWKVENGRISKLK
jgi:hypothetical protein